MTMKRYADTVDGLVDHEAGSFVAYEDAMQAIREARKEGMRAGAERMLASLARRGSGRASP